MTPGLAEHGQTSPCYSPLIRMVWTCDPLRAVQLSWDIIALQIGLGLWAMCWHSLTELQTLKMWQLRNCYYQSAESIIEITREEIKRCNLAKWDQLALGPHLEESAAVVLQEAREEKTSKCPVWRLLLVSTIHVLKAEVHTRRIWKSFGSSPKGQNISKLVAFGMKTMWPCCSQPTGL